MVDEGDFYTTFSYTKINIFTKKPSNKSLISLPLHKALIWTATCICISTTTRYMIIWSVKLMFLKQKGWKPSLCISRLIVLLLKQLLPDFLRKNCFLTFFPLQTHLVQFPRSPLFSEKFHHLPPDDILPLVQEVLFLVTETQTIPESRLVAAKSIVIPVYYKVLSYLNSKFPKMIKYVKNSNISIVFTLQSIFKHFICFCFAVNFHHTLLYKNMILPIWQWTIKEEYVW